MPIIIRPFGDTDLANATIHTETALPQIISGLPEDEYEVGRIAWAPDAVVVTAPNILTAANDSDEAEFFPIGAPGGNIGITVSGSEGGVWDGTYTTDHAGAAFTLADVQAAPVALTKPVVTGNTGDGDVLTILPALFVYDGPALAPVVRRQQLDGINVPVADGGDQLTFTINLANHSGQAFTVEETFGGVTVESAAVTIDTASSFLAGDANAIFWYDPEQITLDGSNNIVNWPNSAVNGLDNWDLDGTSNNGVHSTWDVADKRSVADGVNQSLRTAAGGNDPVFTDDGGYSIFVVGEPGAGTDRNTSVLFSYGAFNFLTISAGTTAGGNLILWVRDNNGGTLGFGGDAPLVLNNTIPAGKHLIELRVTEETLVEIFVDGRLEYSEAITDATAPGTGLWLHARGTSGGNAAHFADTTVYEMFATTSTGGTLTSLTNELATKHSITLVS